MTNTDNTRFVNGKGWQFRKPIPAMTPADLRALKLPPEVTVEEIESRLNEAVHTLIALPDRDRAWLTPKAKWPETLREVADVWANAVAAGAFEAMKTRRPTPSPAAIDRMIPTLRWLEYVDERDRVIIWLRAFKTPWFKIAGMLGKSDRTAQTWYRNALEKIRVRLERSIMRAIA